MNMKHKMTEEEKEVIIETVLFWVSAILYFGLATGYLLRWL